jgi:nitronate monooxygenase
MAASWTRNRLTAKLGIDYPIIQGPFGGLPSERLTAAVSNFGGLGSYGAHLLAPDAINEVIAQLRSLTSKPFAMNLWVSMEDEGARTSGESEFNTSLAPLAAHLAALGAPRPAYKPYSPTRFEDQVRVLLDANVAAFSFVFGIPPGEILDECRAKRIVTIGTATTPDEAAALQDAGVDAIAASGFEAGGHRGSFLRSPEDSLIGTLSLVPQIVDIVDVPVIAAGGIADARGVIAVFALGAEAVQMGTVFLACEESGASRLHREALLRREAGHTSLTKGFTGRLARGIHNRLMDELNGQGIEILPYPLQRALVRNLSMPAQAAGRSDLLPLWAGQSASVSTCTDISAFLSSLVDEVSTVADAVIDWSAQRRRKRSNSSDAKSGTLEAEGQIKSSVPTFWVPDVARTARWYQEHLGFRTAGTVPAREPHVYASLQRNGAEIMLLSLPGYEKPDLRARRPEGLWDAYFRTCGVAALYESVRGEPFVQTPLKHQPYGDWEFEVRDLNGYVLVFGGSAT